MDLTFLQGAASATLKGCPAVPKCLPDWSWIAKRFPTHVNQVHRLFLEVLYKTGSAWQDSK